MHAVGQYMFSNLHIDVARNSTDDFNVFHDSTKWSMIRGNPYRGPIILGFQVESLIEDAVTEYRMVHDEETVIAEHGLHFSNYQVTFASAVRPGQSVEVEIKESRFTAEPAAILSNRFVVKADGTLALIGIKKETTAPLFLAHADFSRVGDLRMLPDRSYLSNGFFLKRKFMIVGNAKNFLCGSLRDQTRYFDELQEKVIFPEMFPCALLSSALLEKARKVRHDFAGNPMVYTSHKISIDRRYLAQLRSNDALHILIRSAENGTENDFGRPSTAPLDYECYGVVSGDNAVLFRALISLLPLETICRAMEKRYGITEHTNSRDAIGAGGRPRRKSGPGPFAPEKPSCTATQEIEY